MLLEAVLLVLVICGICWSLFAVCSCCCFVPPPRITYNNKTILLVGASPGIPVSLAAELCRRRNIRNLILIDPRGENLAQLKSRLERITQKATVGERSQLMTSPRIWTFTCDPASRGALSAVVDTIYSECQLEVDHIFICPDIAPSPNSRKNYFLEVDASHFDQQLRQLYYVTLFTLKAFLPRLYSSMSKLRIRGHRHVTVIGTPCELATGNGSSGRSAICSAVQAIRGLFEALEQEFVGTGIHFHIAYPKLAQFSPSDSTSSSSSSVSAAVQDIFSSLHRGKFHMGGRSVAQIALTSMTRGMGTLFGNPYWEYFRIFTCGCCTCCVSSCRRRAGVGSWGRKENTNSKRKLFESLALGELESVSTSAERQQQEVIVEFAKKTPTGEVGSEDDVVVVMEED